MSIEIRCDCGRSVRVADGAASGSVECPGCGKALRVGPATEAAPGLPPVIAPAPPSRKRPSAGVAVAAMICGICSLLFGVCVAPLSLLLGLAGLVLGAISLGRRSSGKGMAIAGLATGGVGTMLSLVFVALPLMLMGGMAAVGRPPKPAGPPTVGTARSSADSPPAVLSGKDLADLLTGPLKLRRDPARAAVELTKALAAYEKRRSDDLYLYECVQNFRRHLALAGRGELEDPEHRRRFARAGDELVEKLLARYRRAGEHEQDQRWTEAIDAYRKVLSVAPEADSEIAKNVREHMDYCRHRRGHERRRSEPGRESDDGG